MEAVWILAALCSGFVVLASLLLTRKSPMAPASERSTTQYGPRTPR